MTNTTLMPLVPYLSSHQGSSLHLQHENEAPEGPRALEGVRSCPVGLQTGGTGVPDPEDPGLCLFNHVHVHLDSQSAGCPGCWIM